MPRGAHLKQYHFQPGQSGNPEGRPASGVAAKEIRKLTREHVAEVFNKVMELTDPEIEDLLKDKDTPAFEKAAAKSVQKCRDNGDMSQIHTMLERCIGKVPQKFEGEFTGPGGAPLPPPVINLMPIASAIPVPDQAPDNAQ